MQISGMGQMSSGSLLDLFGRYHVKPPMSTTVNGGEGKLYFDNLVDSASALIMINNRLLAPLFFYWF